MMPDETEFVRSIKLNDFLNNDEALLSSENEFLFNHLIKDFSFYSINKFAFYRKTSLILECARIENDDRTKHLFQISHSELLKLFLLAIENSDYITRYDLEWLRYFPSDSIFFAEFVASRISWDNCGVASVWLLNNFLNAEIILNEVIAQNKIDDFIGAANRIDKSYSIEKFWSDCAKQKINDLHILKILGYEQNKSRYRILF